MSDTIFNFKSMIIGHRGSKGNVMENTLESILYAIETGVDGVHLDIRKCLTGEVVLFHDETVDRLAFKDDFYFTHTINKPISKLQWFHLYNTELIDSLGKSYRIPQLQDVLRHPKVFNSDVLINIEIKDCESHQYLVGLLTELFEEGLYEPSRFLLSSDDLNILTYLKEFQEMENYEKLKIGKIISCNKPLSKDISTSEKTRLWVHTFRDFQTNWLIFRNSSDFSSEMASNIVNDQKVIIYTNDRGLENIVDGIITDKPEIFK